MIHRIVAWQLHVQDALADEAVEERRLYAGFHSPTLIYTAAGGAEAYVNLSGTCIAS
jgi:hypothetical protein